MKATVKQLATATFIALLLMVVNVKAEGTESNRVNNEITESTLSLEKWMTDEAIWNTNFDAIPVMVEEIESAPATENWMFDTETWNSDYSFTNEVEAGLELEGWMMNDITWTETANVNESELQLESWMTNGSTWK